MKTTSMTLMPAAALCGALLFAMSACSDPVGDKPKATVGEAAPVPPGTPPPAAPAAAAPAGDGAQTATRYAFSQDGSMIGFVGAKVTGKHEGGFKTFTGTVDVNGAVETAKLNVEIDMASIFADDAKLTGHLQSPDFFDAAKFPKATFVSTSITPAVAGQSTVTGNLTLHGVTKQIAFPATITVEPTSAKAKAEFGINRKDFNVVYPGKPDDLIKDDVLLRLDINAKKS